MDEFWKYALLLASKMKEKTLLSLLKTDNIYNDKWPQLQSAELEFAKLDLTETQRKVINVMLLCREDIDGVYSELSYIAGYIDCINILHKSDIIEL